MSICYIARQPNFSENQIYELARAIVGAEVQHITYTEFLPVLIGNVPSYRGYDSSVNPSLRNEFSTVAFRLGHTMLSPVFSLVNESGVIDGGLPLRDIFFQQHRIREANMMERIFRGFATRPSQKVDVQIIDDVRSFLFGRPGSGGMDLAALNIQRGRDHGLSDYNRVRAAYGLSAKTTWLDITGQNQRVLASKLAETFDSIDRMDLWTGMLSEPPLPGMMVGETARTIIWEQFNRLRSGDRLWYTRTLSPEWIQWVESQNLGNILIRNTGIKRDQIPRNVFKN